MEAFINHINIQKNQHKLTQMEMKAYHRVVQKARPQRKKIYLEVHLWIGIQSTDFMQLLENMLAARRRYLYSVAISTGGILYQRLIHTIFKRINR